MNGSPDPIVFIAPEPADLADLAPLFPGYKIEHFMATGGIGAV